jgi:hypothetical protein
MGLEQRDAGRWIRNEWINGRQTRASVLMDKVYRLPNLRKAFAKVKANRGAAGVGQETVEMFERQKEAKLEKLAQSLREGSYRPQAIHHVFKNFRGRECQPDFVLCRSFCRNPSHP